MAEPTVRVRGWRWRARSLARALASPLGVLLTVPLLVIIAGGAILQLSRASTAEATVSLAHGELVAQSTVASDNVAVALDQADPVLQDLAAIARPDVPLDAALLHLHDVLVGRPGVVFASISFPTGEFRGAYATDHGTVDVSVQTPGHITRYSVVDGALANARSGDDRYDPRTRPFYTLAAKTGSRVWTEPYKFVGSTDASKRNDQFALAAGFTCAQPIYGPDHALVAVLTVDFNVASLSAFLPRSGLPSARSLVFTGSGVVLAYSALAGKAPAGDELVHYRDFHDHAIDAAVDRAAELGGDRAQLFEVDSDDGRYLASVAPIGGRRAGVDVPLDWHIATVVPEAALLGPARALAARAVWASAAALALAVALAVVLAWNVIRMRREVAESNAQAATAEARATELGSYRLVSKLGSGGMGEVWRAEHRLLARNAAIKLIRPEALADASLQREVRERFRREAQTLASMRSRHTIEIFDFGTTDDGTFYYVMELLDGLDLEVLVAKFGPQPAARVIPLLIQACGSLAEAHEAGLYHRDIKPPNLFVSRHADELDVAKLLDFGIVGTVADRASAPVYNPALSSDGAAGRGYAATVERAPQGTDASARLTRLGVMVGTPGFMSPEQICAQPIDGRADLYALGCCAWWLLAGEEVFSWADGQDAMFERHLNAAPTGLGERVVGWFPRELEAVILGCLAKDPRDRPQTARALAASLSAIEIPADVGWSATDAVRWWQSYQPPPVDSTPSSESLRLVTAVPLAPPSPASATAATLVSASKRSQR